jgi:Cys-tRNA(Pro)/Cys-tRNA(Cys) deacylase
MLDKDYEQKLVSYIQSNGIPAEHLIFTKSCHSVAEAAQALNVKVEDIVKNICLISNNDELVVVILNGGDKLDFQKVKKCLNMYKPRMATSEEILEKVGYPCGGTPSFGYDAKFLIDLNVFKNEIIYSGGGSEKSIVKIRPQDLKRFNNGIVVDIHK